MTHQKGLFVHVSGTWTGKTHTAEAGMTGTLSSHIFLMCFCPHILSIWRLQGDGSSYMIAEASKEKQAGVAWLFLM